MAAAAYTISATNVPGVGTVLVNGEGRTLYLLTSEKGGKVTCTDASGCTKYWPDTELPAGVSKPIAGSGIQASMLGTTKDASGSLFVTYASYPLYEFAGDQGAGTAKGEGIKSFGGILVRDHAFGCACDGFRELGECADHQLGRWFGGRLLSPAGRRWFGERLLSPDGRPATQPALPPNPGPGGCAARYGARPPAYSE